MKRTPVKVNEILSLQFVGLFLYSQQEMLACRDLDCRYTSRRYWNLPSFLSEGRDYWMVHRLNTSVSDVLAEPGSLDGCITGIPARLQFFTVRGCGPYFGTDRE
jgi:hypothetical protein